MKAEPQNTEHANFEGKTRSICSWRSFNLMIPSPTAQGLPTSTVGSRTRYCGNPSGDRSSKTPPRLGRSD